MTAESNLYQDDPSLIDYTAVAACVGGQIIQMRDGRCAQIIDDLAAGQKGTARVRGIVKVPKTASVYILKGGRVFWDVSATKAHYWKNLDLDFFMGTAVETALDTDSYVYVNLNMDATYNMDLARDPYRSVLVGTAALNGFGFPYREGGALRFNLTATNEAQKVDALSVDGIKATNKPIVEMAFRMPAGGSASASDFSLGLADGTHASDADQIANSIFIHMDGGSTTINAECDDGTNETAATTTATTFTAGTDIAKRVEVWIDCSDLTSLKFYVNGARVASGTTFSVAAMTATLYLLAHLEKTTGTETADMTVDWLRVRCSNE